MSEKSPISNNSALVNDSLAINTMLGKLPQSAEVVASAVLKAPGKSAWMYEFKSARLFIFSRVGDRLHCDTYAKVPNEQAANHLGDAHNEGRRQGLLGSRHMQHMVISYIEITRNEIEDRIALSSIRERPTLYELYSSNPHATGGNVPVWITPTTAPPSSEMSMTVTTTACRVSRACVLRVSACHGSEAY